MSNGDTQKKKKVVAGLTSTPEVTINQNIVNTANQITALYPPAPTTGTMSIISTSNNGTPETNKSYTGTFSSTQLNLFNQLAGMMEAAVNGLPNRCEIDFSLELDDGE